MVYCARCLLSNQPILADRLPSNLSFALAFLSLWGRAAAGLNEIRSLFPHVRLMPTDEKRILAGSWKQYLFALNGLQIGCQIVIERVKVKYMRGKWNGCSAFCVLPLKLGYSRELMVLLNKRNCLFNENCMSWVAC
jgi:hypothetical protein